MNLSIYPVDNIVAQRISIPSEFITLYHKDKKIAHSKSLQLFVVVLVCYSETVCIVSDGANELISFLTLKTGIFRVRDVKRMRLCKNLVELIFNLKILI